MDSGIKLTMILGSDSISSSRLVINDNFKILLNALNNYKQYFDEDGVYTSTIISKNNEGTIDLKSDVNNSRLKIYPDKVEINGTLETNGNGIFDDIEVNNINAHETEEITMGGDVEIHGNLKVNGQLIVGESSVSYQNYSPDIFNNNYIDCYNNGSYIYCKFEGTDIIIKIDMLFSLINNVSDKKMLLQYLNKPIVIAGQGLCLQLNNNSYGYDRNMVSNAIKYRYPIDSKYYLVSSEYSNNSRGIPFKDVFTVIKIFPVLNNIGLSNDPILCIEVQQFV
ncbi:hypothetical protein [uncultured Methanobrevibacter sp.]|uniref:hypothetical protein n=1 Tax=uncultured Methanobrevibacter sp. TaxID=253161 RepID=UPI0025D9AE59|nr:hypothetical protein [uncultured Methanobrevibacter sp.]